MKFSLIVPTFGRPEEVTEFLDSLIDQHHTDFEVIIADGTPKDELRPHLYPYLEKVPYPLTILYHEFLPVSDARNEGAQKARGDYFLFLDSDCIIPPDYLQKIEGALAQNDFDLFGGPDAAHEDFTLLQKAISYSMTSMFTTGGIRGKQKSVDRFYPRGFNMGMKRQVFETVQGYNTALKCGEDVDLSIRILEAGFKSGLIPGAFVYHKRRTTLKKFFRQVYRFGAARVSLWQHHPHTMKLAHLFPLAFTEYFFLSILFLLFWPAVGMWLVLPLAAYFFFIFLDAALQNRSVVVGTLSVLTSATMLIGYGWGFLKNFFVVVVLRKKEGINL